MPATKTVTTRYSTMLMKPTPTPPKMLLSHMPVSGMSPPIGVSEPCMALTEPFEVTVVVTAQSADRPLPNRTSLPSREPCEASTPSAVSGALPPPSASVPPMTIGT